MRTLLIGLLPVLAWADTEPRARASDYPAHAWAGRAEIGAEYLARTISEGGTSDYTGVYLVIEVAIYPDKGVTLPVSAGDFHLRINSQKRELLPQTPGMVAAAIRDPEWEGRQRGVSGRVGLGDVNVSIGGRTPRERFPGDPQTAGRPQPPPELGQSANRLALPEGPREKPVSGLIYFAYKAKQSDIRRVELIYDGPAGRQVLSLR